ncbi:hypothetical protein MPLA_340034 [Mesorhizobium sp. ORS 3359]|nr:hypothetical protein MPLA_340034 [Mesorhizobium sp. ORS 3359]
MKLRPRKNSAPPKKCCGAAMPVLEMEPGGPTAVEFMLHVPCLGHQFRPVTVAAHFFTTAETVACDLTTRFGWPGEGRLLANTGCPISLGASADCL